MVNESKAICFMPTDDIQERPGFSDLLTELSDSDVVIELAGGASSRRVPDAAPVQLLQEAVEASYRALAGSIPMQLETVAVLYYIDGLEQEQVAKTLGISRRTVINRLQEFVDRSRKFVSREGVE